MDMECGAHRRGGFLKTAFFIAVESIRNTPADRPELKEKMVYRIKFRYNYFKTGIENFCFQCMLPATIERCDNFIFVGMFFGVH